MSDVRYGDYGTMPWCGMPSVAGVCPNGCGSTLFIGVWRDPTSAVSPVPAAKETPTGADE